jgi:hypothetical protein
MKVQAKVIAINEVYILCWATGVRIPQGRDFFFLPPRPYLLWGSPSLLSKGYRGLFPLGLSGRGVKPTTHFHLVPALRMCGVIPPPGFNSWWEEEFFSSPPRPERLWGTPSLLSNRYQGLFPLGDKAAGVWSWPLTSIYCRGQRMSVYTSTPPILPHGAVLS